MTYRRDIDGLRAIAVLLVIFYHAQIGLCPSGYVGVDVFFVISGFLITGLLVAQIDQNRFDFVAFFSRRMRRLLPALMAMVATTLVAGLFVMGPRDFEVLAGSAIAVLALGPNFFFWGRLGYFEDQVPEQPLLHTWSLGLEEQFYVLFPALLLALLRAVPNTRRLTLGAVTVGSFAFGAWLTGRHPGTAFYLLPTRMWEFMLGGLIALFPQRSSRPSPSREVVASLGLFGVVLAAMSLSRTTPYPGVAALLPAGAASAIIWANSAGTTAVGRMLSGRSIVFIGVLSYSLYLWHWPVIALARYYVARPLYPLETIAALALVCVLTYISYRYVEQVFRCKSGAAVSPPPMHAIVVLSVVIAAGAILALAQDGFPRRLPSTALVFDRSRDLVTANAGGCHYGPPALVAEADLCRIAAPKRSRVKVLLWGDSHANAISAPVAALGADQQIEVWQATYSSCPPILGVTVAHMGVSHHCREFNDMVLSAIRRIGINRVILAAFWSSYLPVRHYSSLARLTDPYSSADDLGTGSEAQDFQNFSEGMERTIRVLKAMGVEVWIVRQIPVQSGFVPMMLVRAVMRGDDTSRLGIPISEHQRSQEQVNKVFSRFGRSVGFLDPASVFCTSGWCACSDGVESFYHDSNHLTLPGAELLKPELRPIFH